MERQFHTYVFWMNIQSFHLSAFVRALADKPHTTVWFGFEEELPETRKQMGWTLPDMGKAKVFDSRDEACFQKATSQNDSQTCHCFGSYFQLPRARKAFDRLKNTECGRVWISEPFEFFGVKGWLRTQRVRMMALREARKSFDRVFAMGKLGTDFFEHAWLRKDQIREFAYTVNPPGNISPVSDETKTGKHRLLFVGQLIRRKGVDILLKALAKSHDATWELSIVGDGPEKAALQSLAAERKILEQVNFLGSIPNAEIFSHIAAADLLILPSRWDGWGAVINEAMIAGTPVVVSDACGAASLVASRNSGQVFKRGDVDDLCKKMSHCLSSEIRVRDRKYLARWAEMATGGPSLANYFVSSCSRETVIAPPWRSQDDRHGSV